MTNRIDFPEELRFKIINYIGAKPKEDVAVIDEEDMNLYRILRRTYPMHIGIPLRLGTGSISLFIDTRGKLATHSSLFRLTAVTREYIEGWERRRAVNYTESSYTEIDHGVEKQDPSAKRLMNTAIRPL